MKVKTNKGTYIQSIEASIIYEHIYRGSYLKENYAGFIPYSLELVKLRTEGINEFTYRNKKNEQGKTYPAKIDVQEIDIRTVKNISKFYTDDVINVKFSSKVHDGKNTLSKIEKAFKRKLSNKRTKVQHSVRGKTLSEAKTLVRKYHSNLKLENKKHEQRIEEIKLTIKQNENIWSDSVSIDELRYEFYKNGFTLMNWKGEDVYYVVYKRSSAKARTGECLFIRKELYETMITWSHMGLDFEKDDEIDIPALSAYNALVASSIEGILKINPKNILLVKDIESVFKHEAIVIEKDVLNNQDILKSVEKKDAKIKNSLWDGQGLLDVQYFKGDYKGKGMILTRQHFFKSCLFNTNIVQFMKDQYGDKYETAVIKDLLGNPVKVKNIHCIITSSSLKVFKFSSIVGTDKEMYSHWKKVVRSEKNVFGVCKSESSTKLGSLDNMPLQQMSYQMLNSLELDSEGIQELCKFEVDYINTLKTDDNAFINHLRNNSTITNAHNMIADLYDHNNEFAKTKLFNKYKIEEIDKYNKHIKKGKIRIVGDYMVLCGNPLEMLFHSIDKFNIEDIENHSLKGNQVYTKLFDDKMKLACFRNPHTSSNNLLYVINKHNDLINTYFNFTNNIIVVNAINFPIQDILSGCDYDSDTVLCTNDDTIVKVAENNDAKVCLNGVNAESNSYLLTNENKAIVDKKIASDTIGRIVNIGQLAQSIMYDAKARGKIKIYNKMKEVVEIISVASTISIDLAKRTYDINIVKELERLDSIVKSTLRVDKDKNKLYPVFLCRGKKNRKPFYYKTPMDYLNKIFSVKNTETEEIEVKVKRANELKSSDIVDIWDLVAKCDENGEIYNVRNANDKQENEILSMVNDYSLTITAYHAQINSAKDNDKKQLIKGIVNEAREFESKIKKRAIKPVTIYAMLYHLFKAKSIDKNTIKILNALYMSEPKKLVNAFK